MYTHIVAKLESCSWVSSMVQRVVERILYCDPIICSRENIVIQGTQHTPERAVRECLVNPCEQREPLRLCVLFATK